MAPDDKTKLEAGTPKGGPEGSPEAATAAPAAPRSSVEPDLVTPANPAAERKEQGAEIGKELIASRKAVWERIKDAKRRIESAYKAKKIHIKGARAEWVADLFVRILQQPLDDLAKEWLEALERKSKLTGDAAMEYDREQAKKFEYRRVEIVKMAEQYLARMTSETGWITPEKLAEMTKSTTRKASIYITLLSDNSEEAKNLIKAFQWAMGMQVEGTGNQSEYKKTAIPHLVEAIAAEFSKGENGLMPCVWMIMSFMDGSNRREVAQTYIKTHLKGKPADMEAFLVAGNQAGVFSPDDMEAVKRDVTGNKDFKLDAKNRKKFADQWTQMNDFHDQVKKLTRTYYGSTNDANRMLGLGNIALFIGEVAAWLTLATNMVVSGFEKGEFKFPSPKKMALWFNPKESPYIAGAAAALGTIHLVRKKERLGQIFESKEEKHARKKQVIVSALKHQKQQATWKPWNDFLRSPNNKFGGAQAFADYTRMMVEVHDGEENLSEDNFTVGGFKTYLENQAAKKKVGKKPVRALEYDNILASFTGLNPESILNFGRIFYDLIDIQKDPSGINGKGIYEEMLKKAV